jgi:hypothetical protein
MSVTVDVPFSPLSYWLAFVWENHTFTFLMLFTHLFNFLWEGGVMWGQVTGIVMNLTTNEMLTAHRQPHLKGANGRIRSPFNRGLVGNIREFFFHRNVWNGHYRF